MRLVRILASLTAALAATQPGTVLSQAQALRDPQGNRIPPGAVYCEQPGGRVVPCGSPWMPLYTQSIPAPNAEGGLDIYRVMSPSGSPAMVVKSSPGRLYSYNLCNTAPTARFVRFHDSASPVAGETPVVAGPIVVSAGTCQQFTTGFGLRFRSAISISISGSAGDNDTTPVENGDVTGFLGYM